MIGYNQRFQELALLCVRMFPEESDKIERYVGGLPDMIHGNIVASKPKTMQKAVEMATELMDKKVSTIAERQAENKRKFENTSRNNQNQQQQIKRQNTGRAYTTWTEDSEEDPEEEPEEDVEIELQGGLQSCYFPYERTMEVDVATEATAGTLPKCLMPLVPSQDVHLRWVSHLLLVTHLIIDDLAPWALRRDLEASRARAREMEAKWGTCQTEIALLKSKNKIREKERELLNHDLENVERALGNVLERVSVLESGENATLKKRLAETETKLEWARMERDMAERRLHVSQGWNKRFYMEMVHIRAVPKPPSNDEDTECPRKK
ncbi:hypothetical protein Tco_0289805 [Tanacetum coccineum]